MKQIIKMIKG